MNSIERTQGAKPAIFKSPRALWTAIARASGATLPLSSQQVTSRQVPVFENKDSNQYLNSLFREQTRLPIILRGNGRKITTENL